MVRILYLQVVLCYNRGKVLLTFLTYLCNICSGQFGDDLLLKIAEILIFYILLWKYATPYLTTICIGISYDI